ncbi:MAG: DUF2975 domain-containing protein [Gammaproteobacteria bacterium]|nr:DUF2975 domain-containing protein [Gammaproteobacteria bacterium]MDA8007419.1 DUF2975 domain-containing protein [Gammaproteobacteria bacterium]
MGKAKEIFFEWSGWALCVCAGVLVALALHMYFSGELLDSQGSFALPRVVLVGVLVAMAGVLVSIGAQLLAQSKYIADKEDQRSRYYFDSCVLAYEEAWKILKSGTNKRSDWVQAGTALRNAHVLKTYITEESHLSVLEVHMVKYRHDFSKILAKPSIFFYGVPSRVLDGIKDLDGEELLDKANELAKEGQMSTHAPKVNPLPEQALYLVWLTAQFPYKKLEEHPIYSMHFSEDERNLLYSQHRGVAQYLHHLDFKHDHGGYKKI